MTTEDEVGEKIVEGITEFAMGLNDREMAAMGGVIYRDVAGEINQHVGPADKCRLAFPTVLILDGRNLNCLVAILRDRLVVSWNIGMLRKKKGTIVVPFAGVRDIRRQAGPTPSTRSATALYISGAEEAVILLPKDKTDTAEMMIRSAIGPVGG